MSDNDRMGELASDIAELILAHTDGHGCVEGTSYINEKDIENAVDDIMKLIQRQYTLVPIR